MRCPALLAAAGTAIVVFTSSCVQLTPPKSTLSLYNVITERTVSGTDPLPGVVHRVELPAAFTLAASAPAGAVSAAFSVNGNSMRVDNQAPFRLTEDAGQKPTAWDATPGTFTITVKFYGQPNAGGPVLAQTEQVFSLSSEGMETAGARLSGAELDAWVEKNVDSVLQKRTFVASNGLAMPYRLFLPPAYSAKVKYPVLIYLHGRGQRGTDNDRRVYAGGLFIGRRSIVSPVMHQSFPAIILVPQCSNKTQNEEWAKWVGNAPATPFQGLGKDGSYALAPEPSDSGKAVLELIEATLREYSVDARRVYLTGISMGGFGTWEYVSRRPELFAAAAPMAGYSDPRQLDRFAKIPFWIFHGGADESNPVQGSRTMYALLQKAGADVRYTEYPDTRHSDTFRKAWTEVDLLPWIFAQRRE
ncbi:MAG: prolyl oligopeptidase family serine peptidase [Opitutaceae bacterium]